MAARSKAWVYSRWLPGIAGSNHAGCLSLVSVVCCEVEVPTTDWSLVQGSATECGVFECDCETSIMVRPRPQDGPKCQRMKAARLFDGIKRYLSVH